LCLFEINEGVLNGLIKAINAAKDILVARNKILLPVFREFQLPDINFGIGIDYGKTIVTRFGFKGNSDLKAFGKCAYNVSKLSKGINEIKVSTDTYNSLINSPQFRFATDTKVKNTYTLIN
jgi:class 3 adenylate cyclase